MNEKMTTKNFLHAYVENLLQGLIDEEISLSYLTIECNFCPLRVQCDKDYEENPTEAMTCVDYFRKNLSDGSAFRAS